MEETLKGEERSGDGAMDNYEDTLFFFFSSVLPGVALPTYEMGVLQAQYYKFRKSIYCHNMLV